MLAQNIPDIPLSEPSESNGVAVPNTEEWKDFGPEWRMNEQDWGREINGYL